MLGLKLHIWRQGEGVVSPWCIYGVFLFAVWVNNGEKSI
tara:strand:- start:709 stop:825 length:117 start_codon:yes stop_codon:yes gene_type:complete